MEAVAAHALVVEGARQAVGVAVEGVAAMEGGVETGDLRRRRKRAARGADAGDIVRLVQRRQRLQRGERRLDGVVDQRRGGKVGPPCTIRCPMAAISTTSGSRPANRAKASPSAASWSRPSAAVKRAFERRAPRRPEMQPRIAAEPFDLAATGAVPAPRRPRPART